MILFQNIHCHHIGISDQGIAAAIDYLHLNNRHFAAVWRLERFDVNEIG